jgi:hypothetical protein
VDVEERGHVRLYTASRMSGDLPAVSIAGSGTVWAHLDTATIVASGCPQPKLCKCPPGCAGDSARYTAKTARMAGGLVVIRVWWRSWKMRRT